LAASAEPAGEAIYRAVAWVIGVPSLVLSWWSAVGYLPLLRPGGATYQEAGDAH